MWFFGTKKSDIDVSLFGIIDESPAFLLLAFDLLAT